MKPRKLPFVLSATATLLLAPAASLLVSSAAFAGNTWDGGGSAVDGLWNWTNNTNWNSNTAPDYGTLLTFAGTAGLASSNNSATSSIAGITFSGTAGAFTLSGSSVTLGASITNNSSSLQTINLPLVFDANRTITGSSGNVTLGGPISGAFTLIKSGTHTLTMNTTGSSFSRLQINAGTVGLGVNDALPTNAGLTTATTTSATLDLNGKTQTLGSTIIFGGSTNTGTATIIDSAGGGLLKLGGDVTQNVNTGTPTVNISAALDLNGATRTFTVASTTTGLVGGLANGIITVSGVISNSTGTAGLTKAGVGTLTLSQANTYNGDTTVSAGLLTLSNSLALQNSTLDTTNIISTNATTGLKTTVTTLTLGGLSGNKALASLFDSANGYGGVTALTLNPALGQTPSYSGVIANGAPGMTLTKTGLGTQALTVANSYTGGTAINGGILSIGNAAALGTTGTISFGGGALQYNGITTDLSSRFSTAVNQAYSIDTNGQTVTWASGLTSSGGTLTKSGAGSLTLTGGLLNTFSGGININGGRLNVLDGLSLTNTAGTITVASGAAFYYHKNFGAGNNLTNALNLSGAGDGSIGALNLRGGVVATGGITLAADSTITHDFDSATIQTGAITGSGRNLQLTTTVAGQAGLVINSAIQTGSGGVSVTGVANSGDFSVRLGGNNTFTGGLTINNGVVQLNSAGALNSTAGSENAVTFGASTTTGKLALNGRSYTISNLTSNATPGSPIVENGNATAVTLTIGNTQNLSGTYAGVLQDGTGGGTLSVTKSGGGTLTLSGTNTYTGATAVNAGILQLDGATHASSAVSIGTNGTLAGTGTVNGTLAVSGKLAPGDAGVVDIETLAAGATTWNSGSIWNFDLSSSDTTADKLDITGNLTKGGTGTYQFNFMGSNPAWNTTYTLVDWSGTTDFVLGDFSFTNLGAGPYGASSFGFNGSSLTFTAVPEPTSALAGVLLTAGLLRRRRA